MGDKKTTQRLELFLFVYLSLCLSKDEISESYSIYLLNISIYSSFLKRNINMKQNFFCRIGLHKWRFSHGKFNRYYECSRDCCTKRSMTRGRGGHQPIDTDWLNGRDNA